VCMKETSSPCSFAEVNIGFQGSPSVSHSFFFTDLPASTLQSTSCRDCFETPASGNSDVPKGGEVEKMQEAWWHIAGVLACASKTSSDHTGIRCIDFGSVQTSSA